MKKVLALLFVTLGMAVSLYAHSGGTDVYGCHTDHKTGVYHCH